MDKNNIGNGKTVTEDIYFRIREKIKIINGKNNIKGKGDNPTLAIVQVGNDPASDIYIKYKRLACQKLEFGFLHKKFDNTILEKKLMEEIELLNGDSTVTGIIVQLPVPKHINEHKILDAVSELKDVDCFNSKNIAKLYLGRSNATFIPATVLGIYEYLKYYKINTRGKTCLIVGKSNIVGKPLNLLLSDENDMACTTISCDRHTQNLRDLAKQADILIVAAGVHHLFTEPQNIKEGAVVIDVGIHRIHDPDTGKYRVQGDVNFQAIAPKCSLITPVPGGVGPITVAALMYNLILAFEKSKN